MSKAMIYIDGVLREMTPEDERYFPEIEMPPHEPTEEERLRADVDYLLMMMEG